MASPLVNMFTKMELPRLWSKVSILKLPWMASNMQRRWLMQLGCLPKLRFGMGKPGRYIPHLTKPRAPRTLSSPNKPQQKNTAFFCFFQVILWCNCWIGARGKELSSWFSGIIFVPHCSAWEHVSNGIAEFMSAMKKKNCWSVQRQIVTYSFSMGNLLNNQIVTLRPHRLWLPAAHVMINLGVAKLPSMNASRGSWTNFNPGVWLYSLMIGQLLVKCTWQQSGTAPHWYFFGRKSCVHWICLQMICKIARWQERD